jgi:hypothetical protein
MTDTIRTQQGLLARMQVNRSGEQLGRRADIMVQTFRDFVISVPTLGGAAPVDSVFGRLGTVVAVAGDYAASEVTNDSGVAGANVDDALDTLAGQTGAEDYILIVDRKATNVDGGTFTSGAMRTRDLNTELSDAGGHASVSANQITLAAGTYRFNIIAPSRSVVENIGRLQNITDVATIETSTSQRSASPMSFINIRGRFTIAAAKVLEVQHQGDTTQATTGFGSAANLGGLSETYTVVEFWREK